MGAYVLNYTTNENIVPILEAIRARNITAFLNQLRSGIPFLLQQRVALMSAYVRCSIKLSQAAFCAAKHICPKSGMLPDPEQRLTGGMEGNNVMLI